MAIFDHERKNGIQMGTVGDECMECRRRHRLEDDYEPERLDYKEVYKFWVNNLSHCLCLDCFKETLGKYILVDPAELKEEEPEKPKASAAKKAVANAKKKDEKKEADKDGSETA